MSQADELLESLSAFPENFVPIKVGMNLKGATLYFDGSELDVNTNWSDPYSIRFENGAFISGYGSSMYASGVGDDYAYDWNTPVTMPDDQDYIVAEIEYSSSMTASPYYVYQPTTGGDGEPHIVVGKDRFITVPEELKRLAVQYDHNIETVTFDCPRYWDEHDMSTMQIYINYCRADGQRGMYIATDVTVDENDDSIMHFKWTIDGYLTEVKGTIAFLVCVKKTDMDGNEQNHWNSELCKECTVSEGMECEDYIVETDPAIITDLLIRMEACEAVLDMTWVKATDEAIADIQEDIADLQPRTAALESGKVDRAGDTIAGALEVQGALTLPNSPMDPEEAEVTHAYISRPTANSEVTGLEVVDGSMTELQTIKGTTVRCENLIDISKLVNGTVLKDNGDGTYTLIRTSTNNVSNTVSLSTPIPVTDNNHVFAAACDVIETDVTAYPGPTIQFYFEDGTDRTIVMNDRNSGNGLVWDLSAEVGKTIVSLRLLIAWSSTEGQHWTFKNPMLNEGSTALPYQPYFSDLKRSTIAGVVSTGRNSLEYPYAETTKTENGVTYTVLDNKAIKIAGTPTGYTTFKLADKVAVKPSTDYAVSFGIVLTDFNLTMNIYLYDADGTNTRTLADGHFTTAENEVAFTCLVKRNNDNVAINATIYPMLNEGSLALPFEPYTEDICKFPEELELGQWDSFNPATGELVRQTKRLVLTGSETSEWLQFTTYPGNLAFAYELTDPAVKDSDSVHIVSSSYGAITNGDAWRGKIMGVAVAANYIRVVDTNFTDLGSFKAHLAELYAAGTPLIVDYKLATPEVIKLSNYPVGYSVYHNGTETVIPGSTDNTAYGAIPEITQKYAIVENPEEAATKGYVVNGLAKKLDKVGGKITGSLTVENGTKTTLPALVVKNDDVTYGLAYNSNTEAYELGQGSVDEDGDFTFAEGEGAALALREDSSTFTDGHVVMWSEDGNKMVDSGIDAADVTASINGSIHLVSNEEELAAAIAANRSPIMLKGGVTITLSAAYTISENTVIDGNGATIVLASGYSLYNAFALGANCVVKNLYINGSRNYVTSNHTYIFYINTPNCILENVRITNCIRAVGFLKGGDGGIVKNCRVTDCAKDGFRLAASNIRIENCTIRNTNIARETATNQGCITLADNTDPKENIHCDYITCENNYFENGFAAVASLDSAYCSHFKFMGNTVKSCVYGVHGKFGPLQPANIIISNNHFYDTESDEVSITSAGGTTYIAKSKVNGVIISDNLISGKVEYTDSNTANRIYIMGCEKPVVTGNHITNGQIRLDYCPGAVVGNNTIAGKSYPNASCYPIYTSGCPGIRINNNIAYGYGRIIYMGSCKKALVSGNYIRQMQKVYGTNGSMTIGTNSFDLKVIGVVHSQGVTIVDNQIAVYGKVGFELLSGSVTSNNVITMADTNGVAIRNTSNADNGFVVTQNVTNAKFNVSGGTTKFSDNNLETTMTDFHDVNFVVSEGETNPYTIEYADTAIVGREPKVILDGDVLEPVVIKLSGFVAANSRYPGDLETVTMYDPSLNGGQGGTKTLVKDTDYTYDSATGTLSLLLGATGIITITAPPVYTVSADDGYTTSISVVQHGATGISFSIYKEGIIGSKPTKILGVEIGETALLTGQYSYDSTSGSLTINVAITGNIMVDCM
jgi:hypothetical protein